MLKKIALIIIFVNICSTNIYSMIINTNNTRGLYFSGSGYVYYYPNNNHWEFEGSGIEEFFRDLFEGFTKGWKEASLNPSFFYRMPLWNPDKVLFADSYFAYDLFSNTKFEAGIVNNFGITGNVASAYIDFIPVNFFSIKARVGSIYYSTLVEYHGFYEFDTPDAEYSVDIFYDTEAQEKFGYFFEIEPTLSFDIGKFFSVIANLRINYQDMFVHDYYYDRFTSFIRKNKTFSFTLNNYLMYNASPVSIGFNHEFVYVGDFDELNQEGHKIGVATSFYHQFSDMLSLFLDVHIGQHISGYVYLDGDSYFELELGLSVKIF